MNHSNRTRPKALIAEDVRLQARFIGKALESDGFECAFATDGQECLDRVRLLMPDLIVLDLMMPKIHGIDVLKRLRADPDTSHIAVIICTAKGFKTELESAMAAGADDVIIKPFEPHQLIAKARALVPSTDSNASGPAAPAAAIDPACTPEPYLPTLDPTASRFRLWGTRGSIPVSAPRYARHGGNTTCMQLDCGEEIIIFDAGSGIRELGAEIAGGTPRKIHLFMTHTHWDHIQGFPFFLPAYLPGFEITIYSARGFSKDLRSIFQGQLDQDYFPVQMEDMQANLVFEQLSDEPTTIQGASISWEYVQHPGATVGYKIDIGGTRMSFIPDNEFLKGYFGSPLALSSDHGLLAIYQPIIDFLQDIDILIHEAQYTPEEYRDKVGWGHTSVPNACYLAKVTNAKRWIVIHHDPAHCDEMLQSKLNLTRELLREFDCSTQVLHGFDGLIECI